MVESAIRDQEQFVDVSGEPVTPIDSTTRALVVLDLIASTESGPSIRTLSDQLGLSRSATHRILQSLAREGYAVQARDGQYSVGPRLVQLAARVMSVSSLATSIQSVMQALVSEVGETAYLARFIEEDLSATYIRRVECTKPLRYVQPLGMQVPLHAGAAGKAILARSHGVDPADLELIGFTSSTITDIDALREELEKISAQGFATSVQESVEGAAGVAAAVTSQGTPVGSLTVTVPVGRIPEAGLASLGPTVRAYADQITELLQASGLTTL